LHSDDGESEFAFCLWAVQDYQLEMALNGFFVRGGFTIGSLFMDEITAYGKALIDAYSIESNIAVEPRIVLSEEALSLVKSHTEFYSEPHLSPQNSQISVDTDGKGFVNYLQRLEYCNDDSLCIDIDKLITHKESVMKAALSNVSNTKVWQKYYWLCNYHNYFCSHVSNYNGFRSEARIDESFFRREPSKLVNE